jgi:hypothetical protein
MLRKRISDQADWSLADFHLRDLRFALGEGFAATGLRRARGRGLGLSPWRPGIQGEPKRRHSSHMRGSCDECLDGGKQPT